MASIQSLGVGSGLLTSDLVEDIISAEREATDLRLEAKRAEIDARISSFATIKSSVDQLRSATSALSVSSGLLASTTTSTEETAVTATASPTAEPGVHSVEVQALARQATLASIRFDDVDEIVGDGTLDIRFGTTTLDGDGNYDTFTENQERAAVSITIDPGSQTLGGIRDAINEAEVGVTASIVNDGEGYVLVLKSDQAGEDNSLEITVTEGATAGLSALAFNAAASTPGTHMTQNVAGQDAQVTVDGIAIRREENSISEVIPGVTFNITALTTQEATITVAQDADEIGTRVQTFVDAFNDVKALVDELTDFDEDAGTGALLIGDSTIRGVRTQMRRLLTASINELTGSNVRALVDIGITTNQNANFSLQLDQNVLAQALAENPTGVQDLLTTSTQSSDEFISVIGFQNATEPGTYDVNISQLATQGTQTGATVAGLAGGVTIDDDNDELTVAIDGVAASLTLTQGAYADGDAIAQELQNQINANAAVISAGRSVTAAFDADNNQLILTSGTYGSQSQVAITVVDTNTAAALGLDVDDGESSRGVDVAGSINGIDASGSGQFLTVPSGPVPASAGAYRGVSVTSFDSPPLTIDGTNDQLTVNVDGTTSATISLTQGDYGSGQALAAELQTQINADANLIAQNASVAVVFNSATSAFEITSQSQGASSKVDIVSVSSGMPDDLGLTAGAGTAGKNQSLVADDAGGLQIHVFGGTTGERGDVALVRGVMSRFDRYLDDILAFDGSLQNKISSLETQLDDINEEATQFDDRMDLLEERLRTQFAAADALISQLNSTGSFLDSQLENLPGFSSNN